ncbi:MAG: ACT domain-containing protein [Nocardioides sp.]|uniref:glycine cleavage system protein R n=1 Tax=Nocardioides sp. TaxID=35761 RepID=UPI0039E6D242
MATVVLTLLGTDRAGLVSAVSQLITERGGSWERSQMAHLAGTFAGIVEIDVPSAQVDALVSGVEALGSQGLRVSVERSGEAPPASTEGHRMSLHLVGADRPGIVAEVSALLARHGVNLEELSTQVVEAPMAGGTLFEADAVAVVPDSADTTALRSALEALANELMVDLDLHEGS